MIGDDSPIEWSKTHGIPSNTPKNKAATARESVKNKIENPFPLAHQDLSDIDEELPADEYPTLDLNLGFKNLSN